jgi:type VI secretion system VasD/TssJ family lipoprotein
MSAKALPMVGLMVLVLVACASQPPPLPDWSYAKDAIRVAMQADAKLNLDEGVPHTLLVCLYQLKEPNAFNQLAGDTDGIYKLLECSLFDPSVATAKRFIVQPGQDIDVTLDRAADARYVTVVAGYYTLEKDRMIRLYDIPVVVENKGLIRTTKLSKPGMLKIDIRLGPSQIN